MVKTNELMQACFEAKSKEEMWLCRDLALSIADQSPYAWKLYYSGGAKLCLSKKAIKALKIVMRRVERIDGKRRAKKKLNFDVVPPDSPTKKMKDTEDVASSLNTEKEEQRRLTVEEELREGKLVKKVYVFGGCVAEIERENEEATAVKGPATHSSTILRNGTH